ncbi:chemotaxis protein CheW [Roseateles asaccharophilus]|uniref:Chemotaxis signal transduction protein n=1 Tax=Roseateles asaccharophilus TaxID=582607 RepID=A0ABU2A486_9BURK|nr:chemotaxis protein CheW [Roseateles asaccharophilus]MDR7332009.1 chemotaxis signal transduction protein [Roseateles asaccharophilus]
MNKVWHKGLPFSPEVAPYLRHMALVDEHREALLRLQGVWDSLALLGQMSGTATDIAQTRTAFQNLTTTLLDSLARRLRSHALERMAGKARVAIDILVRNLFERTADVGFLAVDGPLCTHAALDPADAGHAASRAALQARFAAYTAKYSVYDDVIVLSPRGEVLARRDDRHAITHCDEPWIAEALASDAPYFERHGATALLGGRQALIYARALRDAQGVIGLLCLSFRLDDEMAAVFRQLLAGANERAVICLLDERRNVLQSSDAWQVPPGARLPLNGERITFAGRDYLCATASASGYEGYMGPPGWQACVLTPLEWAFDVDENGAGDELHRLGASLDTRQLFDVELQGIPLEARRIQRNLSRTLWNGKLRSHGNAGQGGAGFATTLLNEVQRTGGQLRQVFEQAIAQLQSSALAAVFDGALFQARLAIDIMDRNLYERANDCRWWALDVRLQRALAAQGGPRAQASAAEAQQVLQHINGLYTVYSLLLVFDTQGRVVAVSDPAQARHVGRVLTAAWVGAALGLRDPERHVVSRHEASPLYETPGAVQGETHRPTYVYATSLQHEGQVVGGIALVFDGAPQFSAMLRDALPDETGAAAALFVARDGRLVASSDARWPAGTPAPLPATLLSGLAAGGTLRTELEIGGMVYAAGVAMSQGYREYRAGQAESAEDVAAVLLMPLGPRLSGGSGQADAGFVPPPAQATAESLDIAAFSVGGAWLGLPAGQLVEAVEQPRLTALPNAPRALVGMLQHEGRMLPVLDLGQALYGRTTATPDAPVIICHHSQGQGLAVRVDELGPVFSIPTAQALPSPGGRARLVRGADTASHRMLTLLHADDLWAHIGLGHDLQRTATVALPAP